MVSSLEAQLDDLRHKILPVLEPYVTSVSVFGSTARGEAGPDSDVDLLVELKPAGQRPALGLRWFALEEELAVLLGRPVELVTESALSPRVRPYVEQARAVL